MPGIRKPLSLVRPDLAAEWSIKNDRSAAKVGTSSKYKAVWDCPYNHEWETRVVFRTKDNPVSCLVCSGKQLLRGFNDLASKYPEISQTWHPSKNGDLTPFDVLTTHSHKVWWVCPQGHSWQAPVNTRISRGDGCPVCSNKIVVPGQNDLATTHPHLAQSWVASNPIAPTEVTSGSHKRVKWMCLVSPQHEQWETFVYKRANEGQGCPTCQNRVVRAGDNDLAAGAPYLIPEWDWEGNDVRPTAITAGSSKQVRWICLKNPQHSYSATPKARVKGQGCPYCAGKKVLAGGNDLQTNFPELMIEWDWEANNTQGVRPHKIIPGSKNPVAWKCVEGHIWQATPDNRTRAGSGCPTCAHKDSKGERELANWLKLHLGEELVFTRVYGIIPRKELDIYIPSKKVAIEFNGLYWHSELMKKDKNYHANKYLACQRLGIQLIQIWEDDWKQSEQVVRSMLAHKLGFSEAEKVPARQTSLDPALSIAEANEFLQQNHIQGGIAVSSYRLGLRNKKTGELVAALLLTQRKPGQYEVVRYATSAHVVGGFSKMIAWVDNNISYGNLLTFSDNQISKGKLYEDTGWTLDKEIPPDYCYLYKGVRVHKFRFRIKRFKTDPDLIWHEGLSERKLAQLNKIPRIWDSGKVRWKRTRPER